ncbi:hypothetical protein H8N03_01690 [Ramlibacter sp. USB13]|uniref:Uncharacterized protein n=1 Tax=Ramlibacter cellulosilyticus TaxID=2764187 RepID=A0A923MMZ7_9BURK|nr:hypothetical protein [Ramlibacter cellulosilyticus]MBC5781636.1 hypothetical protein [Ramlibacter cellulosilyticus]
MSSITANDVDAGTQPARSRMFWVLLGALAAGQLFAFWLLCSHQVRKAEARHNETVVQQMALADCLQYIPGSTIASCTARGDVQASADKANVSAAVPVSFSFR